MRRRTPPVGSIGLRRAWVVLAGWTLACAVAPPDFPPVAAEVEQVLDALHRAASEADEDAYFALFAPDAVFFGTDPSERWSVEQFREYAHPHFSQGRGWTYTLRPGGRNVYFGDDGTTAWFDEVLDNAAYGECRGTGVLRKVDGVWRIAQYNLSIPIPNDLALDVVEQIRQLER